MDTHLWHTALPGNEFDYPALMGALDGYRYPRDKATVLMRRGDIVRVKKGIYVLGPALRRGPVSREILANLIYGPSYLSLEYALSFYQLIPERVETVTSITLQKTKSYDTPMGRFTYRHVKTPYYGYGLRNKVLPDGRGFLIACPEKAIADKVYFAGGFDSAETVEAYLFSDLRIAREEFARLERPFFTRLAEIAGGRSLGFLAALAGSGG